MGTAYGGGNSPVEELGMGKSRLHGITDFLIVRVDPDFLESYNVMIGTSGEVSDSMDALIAVL